jgi:hypothetical protein
MRCVRKKTSAVLQPTKTIPRVRASLTTKPYPEFNFRHKFSLLVVATSQSGKTYFVQQIFENNRIVYEEQRNIHAGGSELVIGGIAGADSLTSIDGSASAILMAFFENVGAADHRSGSEVVIGGFAGADSLTSVDGTRPFEDVGAAYHTSGSEVVIGGIAGADSLTSVDGHGSAISMAFFEDVVAAYHTNGSEVVIGGIAGADSLTSVDGHGSAISMAPFKDVAAADHTSGSELDKLREVSVAEILSVTFDDTAVAIGIRTGEAILWSRALYAKIFLGGDDVFIAAAIPGVSCSSSELSSVYSTRL